MTSNLSNSRFRAAGARCDARCLVTIAWAILAPLTCSALDPGLPLDGYERRQWTMDDGLPDNTITALAQDRDGTLWIGTNSGLVRFDGTRFHAIQTSSGEDNDGQRITAVHPGPSGAVWFAVEGHGVSRWIDKATEAWSVSPKLGHVTVTSILEDSIGRVWIATAGHGLMVFDKGRARWLTESDGWEHSRVTGLIEDQRAHVWAGTLAGGVCRFSGQGPVKCTDFAGLDIIDLEIDPTGNILLLSERWLSRVPPDRKIAQWPVDADDGGFLPTAAFEDSDGCRWTATRDGLEHSHGESTERLGRSDGFTEKPIVEILEDSDGNIWIATAGAGLMRISAGPPPNRKASE